MCFERNTIMSGLRYTLALLALSFPGLAASQAPAPAEGPAKRVADKLICEKIEVTGSRVAVKRVCLTQAQWDERRRDDRAATEKMQIRGQIKEN